MQQSEKYITMLNELTSGIITPRSVVGGGYKNGRKVAMEWIQTQIHNAVNAEAKVCQLHGNTSGIAFASKEKAMKSHVYKTLMEKGYKTINKQPVTEFGLCKASVGEGFLIFVKISRPIPLSKMVSH